jgi:hypothetical protein
MTCSLEETRARTLQAREVIALVRRGAKRQERDHGRTGLRNHDCWITTLHRAAGSPNDAAVCGTAEPHGRTPCPEFEAVTDPRCPHLPGGRIAVSAALEGGEEIAQARVLARAFDGSAGQHGLPVSDRVMGMVELVVSTFV